MPGSRQHDDLGKASASQGDSLERLQPHKEIPWKGFSLTRRFPGKASAPQGDSLERLQPHNESPRLEVSQTLLKKCLRFAHIRIVW